MPKLTYAELESLTGFSFKTLKKRLDGLDGEKTPSGVTFESALALKRLYEPSQPKTEELSVTLERAKLARAQTTKIELETEILRETYVKASEVAEGFARILVEFKDRLRGLPLKLSAKLSMRDPEFIFAELTNAMDEELKSIADQQIIE